VTLSEAVEVLTNWANTTGRAGETFTLTRREATALQRLLADARITLENISRGVIRREGRSR
jgi:hypothetical protein